jgi:HTH-type transcriptional regulator/antitoxin HigA
VAVLASIDGKPNLSVDELDYSNTLAMLVKEYERPRALPKRTVMDRLRHLMSETGINVSGLGRIIGSQPEASMVLAGTRELSKEHIRRLSAHFRIDAGYFF